MSNGLVTNFLRKASLCACVTTFTFSAVAEYKDAYEADEALLEKLTEARMTNWIKDQVKAMESKYASRTNDMEFLKASYSGGRSKVIEELSKITTGSSRYPDAQLMIAKYTVRPEDQMKILERLKSTVEADKSDRGIKVKKDVFNLLMSAYMATGNVNKAIPLIKELSDDPRYIEYMTAHLKLKVVDKYFDTNNRKLDSTHTTIVQAVAKALKDGQLLWTLDYKGLMGNCELAHAYYYLNKPTEAVQCLTAAWKQINEMDKGISKNDKGNSPKAAGMFYLAQNYTLHAQRVKKGGKAPKIGGKQLTKEKAIEYYLKKAYNIFQVSLQKDGYERSQYAKRSFREAEEVRKLMSANGLKAPKAPRSETMRLVMEDANKLYNLGKYDEAYKKFDEFAKGKDGKYIKEPAILDALFLMTACRYKTEKWQESYDTALTAVELFPKERKAWDALYNAAVNMLKAKSKQKTLADKQKVGDLSANLFTKLAKEYSIHPSSHVAAWQVAEGYWKDAMAAGTNKKSIQSKLKKARTPDERNALTRELNEAIRYQRSMYEKSIPAYQVMAENYANTKYGRLAFYKMGWVYYILEKKEQAVEMFAEYIGVQDEAEPGVWDYNYIQAKDLVADISFRANQLDVAEELFAEVLAITEKGKYTLPKDPKSAKVAERTILNCRRKAMALTPWVDDQRGQNLLDKAESLLEDIEDLDDTIKQYETAIEQAKDAASVEVPPPAVIPAPESAPTTFTAGKMPSNFAFKRFLERVPMLSDLVTDLPVGCQLTIKDGLLWAQVNNDVIGGLGGKGLKPNIRGKRVEWDSTLVACYRAGKLIGIFDPANALFRAAKDAEAPAAIKLPLPTGNMSTIEAQIRLQFLRGTAIANRKEADRVKNQGSAAQTKALTTLQKFLSDRANAQEKVYSPGILLRIATIHVNREEWDKATIALQKLQKKYPSSDEAGKAPAYMFRVLSKAAASEPDKNKAKELKQRATSEARKLVSGIKELSASNLNFIAFKLVERTPKLAHTCLDIDVATKGLNEVLRRGEDKRADQHERFAKLRSKAIYYMSIVYFCKKDYGNAISQIDKLLAENSKSAYAFRLQLLKGQAVRAQGKFADAIKILNSVISRASTDRKRFKVEYWTAMLEASRTLIAEDNSRSAKKAQFRLQQGVESIDSTDPELRTIRESFYFELACIYAKLGKSQEATQAQTGYLRAYPSGVFRKDISNLPGKKY